MSDNIMSVQEETVKRINDALGELVKPTEQDRAHNDYLWIVFSLGDADYAITAGCVLSVAVLHEIIPYADAPAYCPGVIWDRKGIIDLLDLHVLLGRGNFLTSVNKEKSGIPVIIIIEPDGKRRGIIADKIVALEYVAPLSEAPINEGCVQSRYIKGTLKYDPQKSSALIISLESFSTLEFGNQNAKINWKGRIDMEMKIDGL